MVKNRSVTDRVAESGRRCIGAFDYGVWRRRIPLETDSDAPTIEVSDALWRCQTVKCLKRQFNVVYILAVGRVGVSHNLHYV